MCVNVEMTHLKVCVFHYGTEFNCRYKRNLKRGAGVLRVYLRIFALYW